MHDDREQVEARIRRAVADRIRPAIHTGLRPLEVEAWHVPGEPVPVKEAREARYEPFAVGDPWGPPWGTSWFRCRGAVPEAAPGQSPEVLLDLGFGAGPGFQAEGLVFRLEDGGPVKGVHPEHRAVPVDLVRTGDGVAFLAEAAANPIIATSYRPTALGDPTTAGAGLQYRLRQAHVGLRNDDVWHLDLDLQVLTGLMRELPLDDPWRHELLRGIEAALDALDVRDVPATAVAARARLEPLLERPAHAGAHRITAVGHAHIDSAWLWPLRETRRKCARTFASAVTHMERDHPEYRFACSQAVQYAWVEEDHPELFDRIRVQVEAGRFIPVGSMWVEADCNLPSGESLARQLVHGKRWFLDRFGIETREVWIPDVFGYAGNLPQIMALAGCEHFLTQKLSWNQTNPFPHHTFWWEGIDGTRVFTHFPPADTYNAEVTPKELRFAVRNFRDKGRSTRSMLLFGHGDGGGGPTREMLERARRLRGVAGLPPLAMGTPESFFRAAREEYGDGAATWRGELYFEMHRGTYTSQAATKAGNRRCELALREVELWSCLSAEPAPLAPELDRWWKTVLLHQFHDIIPGSSIAWVHDDTEAAHAAVLAEVGRATAQLLDRVLPVGDDVVAANAGPFPVHGVIDGGWADVPAHGFGRVHGELPAHVAPARVREGVLENDVVRVEVAADGTLASVVDLRRDRECLAAPGNVLQLFADVPNTYDAWDVEAHTVASAPDELLGIESLDVVSEAPWAGAIRVVRRFGRSSITQTYRLTAGSARLDIETEVDWHEDEKLLKAAFPLDLRADEARYDVQYGHVRRPTHRNTSWDWARFEVCAHQWADLAEPDFGVALLNDAKYGYDCLGGTLRLTLLRAPCYPDPDADRGRHAFTYSLVPHGAGLAEVLPEAWSLNLPPRRLTGVDAAGLPAPVVSVDHPGVVVTAVKRADDGSGDLVVRMHEAFGGRAPYRLGAGGPGATAVACDLLERPLGRPVDVAERRELRPFQLETLRILG